MPAKTFIDALTALERHGDLEPIVALHADDAELSNPNEPTPLRGRDGAERFWRAYRDAFAEIRSEFRHVLEDGDASLLEWASTGRLASGAPLRYEGVTSLEWAGDRVRRFRAYFDPRDVTDRAGA
jgi:ketosteroid isomerase-like protein